MASCDIEKNVGNIQMIYLELIKIKFCYKCCIK